MMPGMGRNFNPRKMQSMMKQFGIDVNEIANVEQVIIRTPDKDIVFDRPDVSIMDVRGAKTYQIAGAPHEVPRQQQVPDADVKLVAEQTGAGEDAARVALLEAKGDLAEAILKLKK